MAKKKTKKPAKQESADGTGRSQDNSWVKYYCVVFLLLTCVVGYLFFKYRGQRIEFEKATKVAEKYVTGKGIPEFNSKEVPNSIPGLAEQVHQYVQAQKDAVDTSGRGDAIPIKLLDDASDKHKGAGVERRGMSEERKDKNSRGGYETISRQVTYEKTTLRNLVKLIYNLERRPPMKVFDIRWQILDAGEQEAKPFDRIGRPVLKVGVRRPLGAQD